MNEVHVAAILISSIRLTVGSSTFSYNKFEQNNKIRLEIIKISPHCQCFASQNRQIHVTKGVESLIQFGILWAIPTLMGHLFPPDIPPI